jgi:hypothetical protein
MKREEFLNIVCANTVAIKIKEIADLRAEIKCYMPESMEDIDTACDLLEKICKKSSEIVRAKINDIPFGE